MGINKREVDIFQIYPVSCVVYFQFAFIKNFCISFFIFIFFFVGNVIKVKAQNVEKGIDIIKPIVDIYDANKSQNDNINNKTAYQRQIKRDCKKHKKREIAQKVLISDIVL